MQSSFSNIMKNWKRSAVIYKMIFKYFKAQIWNWNILQSRYDSFHMSHLIMSHFILQQLVIEWKDREECCFGYVAMVSDAIPERNLMTFTKGWFCGTNSELEIPVWAILYDSYRRSNIRVSYLMTRYKSYPLYIRIPTVKLKTPGKKTFLKSESRTSVTFKL